MLQLIYHRIYGQMQLLNCVKNDKKINDNVHRAVDIRALYKVSTQEQTNY